MYDSLLICDMILTYKWKHKLYMYIFLYSYEFSPLFLQVHDYSFKSVKIEHFTFTGTVYQFYKWVNGTVYNSEIRFTSSVSDLMVSRIGQNDILVSSNGAIWPIRDTIKSSVAATGIEKMKKKNLKVNRIPELNTVPMDTPYKIGE